MSLFFLFLLTIIAKFQVYFCHDIDPNGYIAYCPCMGRFGNQADHFLGALGFSKGLNRTLILPHWIEYSAGAPRSIQIPFDKYFDVEPLKKYHRVILMKDFMNHLASSLWPQHNRIALCYMPRHNSNDSCKAKEGNPFASFWDTFNIDFVGSSFYRNLLYDVNQSEILESWNARYPKEEWKVLSFTSAPATFPVTQDNRILQKYLFWNEEITNIAKKKIALLPKGPFIAIHLRNGVDWERACEHVEWSPALFAAPQCLGYRNEHGKATMELCMPSDSTITKQLKRTIKSIGATSIMVSSDHDHKVTILSKALEKMKVTVHKMDNPDPHVELAIMGLANHFIGNCISSFSSFVKRERDSRGFPSSFWAFPLNMKSKKSGHVEL